MNSEKFQPQIARRNAEVPSAGTHLCPSATSVAKKETASPKISVIVPVYKVEKYLPECIESILAQTFPDFELILVDDGSPDNSGKICDDYAARDPRIRVFHKENGGVSSARNLGLDHARGEWIAFVDSDDTVSEKYLEILIALLKERGADISLCSWSTMSESGAVSPRKKCRLRGVEIVGRVAAMYRVQNGNYYEGSPYCRLFSHENIEKNKLRFDEKIKVGEDWLFSTKYFARCVESAVSTEEPLYFYRARHGSAMHGGIEGQWSVLYAQRAVRALLEKTYPRTVILRLALNIREGMNFFVLLHLFLTKQKDIRWRFLYGNFRRRLPFLLVSRRLSVTNKCNMLLMAFSFRLWRIVYEHLSKTKR